MTEQLFHRRHAAGHWLAAILLGVAVVGLVVLPILALVGGALELGLATFVETLAASLPSVANSAWTALAATLLAILAGTGLALLTERAAIPGRNLLRLALALSLLVPGYVAAIAWLRAYGPAGLLDSALGLELPGLLGPLGIVLVLAVETTPICYLFVVAALALRAEPDLERAARVAGASALTALRTVTLPLLGPTLAAAGAICFVLNVTAFGVPAVLGIPDGFSTVTTRIYRDLAFSADPAAFSRAVLLALSLALGAVAALGAGDRLLARGSTQRAGAASGPLAPATWSPAGASGSRLARRSGWVLLGALTGWLFSALALVLPLLALLLTALTRASGLPATPDNWTLDNFARALDRHTLAALANSLLLSSAAALGALALAGLAILAGRSWPKRSAAGLVTLTFAIPGSTLAVAMLLAYGPLLRDTLLIILLAYLAKFWLLAYRPLAAALESLAADAHRAARVSGAGAWTTLRTISLPLLRPAVMAGALIVFLFGMHEITMSSLLYGPGSSTLAVVVLNLQQLGDPTVTTALSVLLALSLSLIGLPVVRRLRVLEGGGWRP